MNYYPFHVGDYAAHTSHLEPMEDLAYRRLLDQYYLRESALPADIQATAKLVRMRSFASDVESVLNEFFVLTENGWTHGRCESEIERMQDKQAKARASAQASVSARRAKSLNVRSTDVAKSCSERLTDAKEIPTDVELPTPTPTPIEIHIGTSPQAASPAARGSRLSADWVLPSDWAVWAKAIRPDLDPMAVADQFRDHWISKPGKDGRKTDWQATWRNWVRAQRSTFPMPVAKELKYKSNEYYEFHKSQRWWADAGFETVYDAVNAGCHHKNFNEFTQGERVTA